VVIVLPFVGSVKEYIAAILARGCPLTQPDDCPHPDCQASGSLIRWGTYERRAATEEVDYRIRIQRLRCKVCGRTHSLLPDFLHPHRHFVLALLYRIVALYLIEGWNWESLMNKLPGTSPARSTIREWVGSFAYGAGQLLLDALLRHLLALAPHTEVPAPAPHHFRRVKDTRKRRLLEKAYSFWLLAEALYAQVKTRQPRLHFRASDFFSFLLHWLQSQSLPPRLFWSPTLPGTPTTPF
jgi:hypothetical protein